MKEISFSIEIKYIIIWELYPKQNRNPGKFCFFFAVNKKYVFLLNTFSLLYINPNQNRITKKNCLVIFYYYFFESFNYTT